MNQAHHEIRDQKSNDHAKANQKLKDLTSKEIDNLVNVRPCPFGTATLVGNLSQGPERAS